MEMQEAYLRWRELLHTNPEALDWDGGKAVIFGYAM